MVFVEKRRQPRQQFEQQHTETIEVKRPVVVFILEDLRAEVLWTAADGFCFVGLREVLLRQPEICDLEISPLVDKDIFWLQVSIQNVVLVKVLYCYHHLGKQNSSLAWGELVVPLDEVEQVSARTHIEHHIQIVGRRECRVKLHDEWAGVVVQKLENVFLALNLAHAIHVSSGELLSRQVEAIILMSHHDLALWNDLHGVDLAINLVTNLDNFGKCALS